MKNWEKALQVAFLVAAIVAWLSWLADAVNGTEKLLANILFTLDLILLMLWRIGTFLSGGHGTKNMVVEVLEGMMVVSDTHGKSTPPIDPTPRKPAAKKPSHLTIVK